MGKFDFKEEELRELTDSELLKTKISSYIMTLRTREETYNIRKKRAEEKNQKFPSSDDVKAIKLLNNMIDDIKSDIIKMGGTEEDILNAEKEAEDTSYIERRKAMLKDLDKKNNEAKIKSEEKESPKDDFKIEYNKKADADEIIPSKPKVKAKKQEAIKPSSEKPKAKEITQPKSDFGKKRELFDSIPLPSKGECYTDKEGKIPVAYLTAYDENLIVSPNLYEDGTFIDVLLKNKIMYEDFDPDNLLPGDRDAIILWLRASGYGNEFPVTATDNETGKQFETTVDLSKINYKPFTLKADENGYFDFTLPISKDNIKFRFLTYGLVKKLQKMNEENEMEVKKDYIEKATERLSEYVDDDKEINNSTKEKLNEAIERLKTYGDSISVKENGKIIEAITNKLQLSVVSVNGNEDRDFIKEYINTMPARDSYALRSYITNNEPGVDFNVKVERPTSLGGGSVTMFLTLNQFLFFNIVE